VEHGVEHLVVGDEVVVAARAPQPQLHLHPSVDVEPQQPRVPRSNHEQTQTHHPADAVDRSISQSGGRTAHGRGGGEIGLRFVRGARGG
jgi:hypothetical protein